MFLTTLSYYYLYTYSKHVCAWSLAGIYLLPFAMVYEEEIYCMVVNTLVHTSQTEDVNTPNNGLLEWDAV